jgi:hypothetical protein
LCSEKRRASRHHDFHLFEITVQEPAES